MKRTLTRILFCAAIALGSIGCIDAPQPTQSPAEVLPEVRDCRSCCRCDRVPPLSALAGCIDDTPFRSELRWMLLAGCRPAAPKIKPKPQPGPDPRIMDPPVIPRPLPRAAPFAPAPTVLV